MDLGHLEQSRVDISQGIHPGLELLVLCGKPGWVVSLGELYDMWGRKEGKEEGLTR